MAQKPFGPNMMAFTSPEDYDEKSTKSNGKSI